MEALILHINRIRQRERCFMHEFEEKNFVLYDSDSFAWVCLSGGVLAEGFHPHHGGRA